MEKKKTENENGRSEKEAVHKILSDGREKSKREKRRMDDAFWGKIFGKGSTKGRRLGRDREDYSEWHIGATQAFLFMKALMRCAGSLSERDARHKWCSDLSLEERRCWREEVERIFYIRKEKIVRREIRGWGRKGRQRKQKIRVNLIKTK